MTSETAAAKPIVLVDKKPVIVDGAMLVGRLPENDVVLDSDRVSRVHAKLSLAERGWIVEDLDSLNGTYLNGNLLVSAEPTEASDGDLVEIGGHHLILLRGHGAAIQTRAGASVVGLREAERQIVIGRDDSCDLVIDADNVSRRHAEISWQGGEAQLRDLGSRNGTRVNGERVSAAPLTAGDEIGIGRFRVIFDGENLVSAGTAEPLRLLADRATVRIDSKTLLDGVSVALEPGTLTAIVGQSGAGKSTLLSVLSGQRQVDSGHVELNGEPVRNRRKDIGVVPQADLVHGDLTVYEALTDAAALRLPADLPFDDIRAAAEATSTELELDEHTSTRIARLSGGQRKRVSVGVELTGDPGVLLLDEPTTGLDPGLENRTMQLLRQLTTASRTVAVVTHATRSLELCDQLIVMGAGGRLCFKGTPEKALEFFSVSHFDEIYDALNTSRNWASAFADDQEQGSQPSLATHSAPRRRIDFREWRRDFAVFVRRQLRLLVRDRRNLGLVICQAPLLAIITVLLFRNDVFGNDWRPAAAVQLLFLLVVIVIWLGAIGASRELVKERPIVSRERAAGVSSFPYLAAKVLIPTLVTIAQVIVLLSIVFAFKPLHAGSAAYLNVFVVFVAVSFSAVTMGLAISAIASSESQASSFIPLALIPQLLLGGAIISVGRMSGGMELFSKLIAAQWGFGGAGKATNISQHIDLFPAYNAQAKFGDGFFTLPIRDALVALALISVVQILVVVFFSERAAV
jgi:ABC-type multidrug transport system ATPase subunit/pSer/pThr/pTyr-binding forkhead associated (FHA) protein